MIVNNKIVLFESGIVADSELPKYKKIEKNNGITQSITVRSNSFNTNMLSGDAVKRNVLQSLSYQYSMSPKISLRFKIWFYEKFIYNKDKGVKELSVEALSSFFQSVKENVSALDKKHIDEVINSYEITLKNAQDNHQIALTEKIKDYAGILKNELLLSTTKFNKYLSEEQVVKFYNKASVHDKYKTKLSLTYIKNFVKIIPEDISLLKKEADELEVFDNYVILHYDYKNDSVSETKAETAKRKDPILFGVLINSNKLYYIGDWVDDYCDLTLDVIIKKIGTNAKTINATTLKKGIQQI